MSRSLNTSMAAISSGVARPVVSSITETRYCISDHLLCSGTPLADGRSPLLRTPPPRSDTAARMSFKNFLVRRPGPVDDTLDRWAVTGVRLQPSASNLKSVHIGNRTFLSVRNLGGALSACCASACQTFTAGSCVPPHDHHRTKASCGSTTVERRVHQNQARLPR